MKRIVESLDRAGADRRELWALAGIAYCLTRGDVAFMRGSGRELACGAWGVSSYWHGQVPKDLDGQAAQAVSVFRSRDIGSRVTVDDAASIALLATVWWYPSATSPRAAYLGPARAYAAQNRLTQASTSTPVGSPWWLWVAGAALVLGFVWHRRRK